MLLILTHSQDATSDYLGSVLRQHNLQFIRLDTDTLISRTAVSYRLGAPVITFDRKSYRPSDFTHVLYRRPEELKNERFDHSSGGRYALEEWAEALEGFLAHIPELCWMNHPSRNALASHKLEQLTRAASLGFRVPESLVTQDAAVLRRFFEKHNERIVVKPLASGYIKEPKQKMDSQIYTNPVGRQHLTDGEDLAVCPTFFQQYIDKRSDVRITLIDKVCHAVELFATAEDGSQRCDIRRNNMSDVEYRKTALPADVATIITKLVDHYGLRFAAIDMVVGTNDEWYFLEVNPNGQWAWLDLSAGMNIAVSFVRSFSSV